MKGGGVPVRAVSRRRNFFIRMRECPESGISTSSGPAREALENSLDLERSSSEENQATRTKGKIATTRLLSPVIPREIL